MKHLLITALSCLLLALVVSSACHYFNIEPDGFVFWQTLVYYFSMFALIEAVTTLINKYKANKNKK